MPIFINLTQGHHQLAEPVEAWKAEFVEDTVHSVILTAAIRSFPAVPLFGPTGRPATTLAIQMDQAAAMRLFWQIRELAHSMDWQLPPEGERQA